MRRSSNIAVRNFYSRAQGVAHTGIPMTMGGVLNKLSFLWVLLCITGGLSWFVIGSNPSLGLAAVFIAIFAGLGCAFWATLSPASGPISAPLYAAIEGIVLGGVSRIYEGYQHGIVVQSIVLTAVIVGGVLMLYRSGVVRATPRFTKIVLVATVGIMGFYLLNLAIILFGGSSFPIIWDSGPIGIAFSLFVTGLAAANLVVDFSVIEEGCNMGASNTMEWYAAFSLTVTIVWLYIEVLRLLSKLRR